MSFVAVAIGGSALVGGATSLIAGGKAAKAQKQAAETAAGVEKYMYDTTREDFKPYRDIGNSALGKLGALYGVGDPTDWDAFVRNTPGAYQAWLADPQKLSMADFGKAYYQNDLGFKRGTTTGADGEKYSSADANYAGLDLAPYAAGKTAFETTPGYQFRLDEGLKAIERSAASRGALKSGATLKALNNYAQGTASSEYEKYADRLASLAGVGQSATGSTAQAGANYADGASNAAMAAGNARASSYTNAGNAVNSALQGGTAAFLYNRGYGGGGGGGSSVPPSYLQGIY